jgi:hypothetical protein
LPQPQNRRFDRNGSRWPPTASAITG